LDDRKPQQGGGNFAYISVENGQVEVVKYKGITPKFWDFYEKAKKDLETLDQILLPLVHRIFPKDEANFPKENGLMDCLSVKEEDVPRAILQLIDLALMLEEKGYKMFAIDQKSIHFDAELKAYIYLYYPFYMKQDDYDLSSLELPIYINSKPPSYEMNNSHLFAELFALMKFKERYLQQGSQKNKRYFVLFSLRDEGKFELADWFRNAHRNKYKAKECKEQLELALKLMEARSSRQNEQSKFKGFRIAYHSYEGSGKLKDYDDFRKSEEVNQDSYYCDVYGDKALVAVMDGVSSAKIGNGNIASNLIKDVLKEKWEEYRTIEITEDSTKSFFEDVIATSNLRVVEEAKKISNKLNPADIMSSTMTAAILHRSTVYLCTVGDSPAYVLSETGMKRLNVEHNLKYERLVRNLNKGGEPDSLTQYIGKAKLKNGEIVPDDIDYQFLVTNLLNGEILMISSDGVLDYCNGLEEEEKEENFKELFNETYKKVKKLKAVAHRIIAKIDENEAGDNLTIVLIKPEYQ